MPRRPPSRWLVYVLRCADDSLYTGITNDLARRLEAHAAGRASKYTRSRLPVRLVHSEPQASQSAALKREAAVKRLRRGAKERLLEGRASEAFCVVSEDDDGSPPGKPPPDWYLENGLLVYTAAYHLKRGSCCGSGCRHCPYEPRHVAGATRVRP